MMLVSVISYVDRNTLALLAPTVLAATGLSMSDYGWVVSAYSIAFMIGNPLWGRLLDRIGLRAGMTWAVLLWSMASVGHAFAGAFWSFALLRAVLGLGEGAAAPGGLRTVTHTLPAAARSRGIALAYSGGSAGAIITPLLMAPIAAVWGYQGAFVATGVLGGAWIAWWLVLSAQHPELGAHGAAQTAEAAPDDRPSLRDRRLLGMLAGYALGALPLGFTVYSAALYLSRVLGQSQLAIGAVLWVPPLGSELGIFFWGFVADRLALRATRLAVIDRLLPLAVVLSLPLALLPQLGSVALALGGFFFAMFVASAFQLLLISYGAEVFPKQHAGYIGGLASGAYGAALAVMMPLFGKLFDAAHYDIAFALAAACPVLGYLAFRLAAREGAAYPRPRAPERS